MGFKQLISDAIRSIKTGQNMKNGVMPQDNRVGVSHSDWNDYPDHYTLPEYEVWVIEGKSYRNAGEAKAAVARSSSNHYL